MRAPGREDDTRREPRPFDATRDGFVMGEGACMLVLEGLEGRARARRDDLRRAAGYGGSNDAYHMAQPAPEAIGVAR